MKNEEFEEYLWDTIHDVLMRVISDLETLQYDLSVVERLRDEPKRLTDCDASSNPWSDYFNKDSTGGK